MIKNDFHERIWKKLPSSLGTDVKPLHCLLMRLEINSYIPREG